MVSDRYEDKDTHLIPNHNRSPQPIFRHRHPLPGILPRHFSSDRSLAGTPAAACECAQTKRSELRVSAAGGFGPRGSKAATQAGTVAHNNTIREPPILSEPSAQERPPVLRRPSVRPPRFRPASDRSTRSPPQQPPAAPGAARAAASRRGGPQFLRAPQAASQPMKQPATKTPGSERPTTTAGNKCRQQHPTATRSLTPPCHDQHNASPPTEKKPAGLHGETGRHNVLYLDCQAFERT